ncbi:MAG: glycerate kinase [Clostridia bacterium]|nr:glycerate kinase [Clostridia bacterium]
MKVVIAIDSYKGSLTALEAAEACAEGIRSAIRDAECVICPIADGGEGTVDAAVLATGGEYRSATVSDPLGRPITASYGLLPGGVAIIEMSAASGITLVDKDERDPFKADTYGVGELILDAYAKGARRFIIGIGGSATNDGGSGMLRALGFSLLDKDGKDIGRGAEALAKIASINADNVKIDLHSCNFSVACDVKNPLLGENGATYIYGPQKGVLPEDRARLDSILAKFASVSALKFPAADPTLEGAGAAGGLGFALVGMLGAKLCSGIELIMDITGLEEKLADADIVVTGEGRMDKQSAMGKVPVGVARLAKMHGKPVVALAGSLGEGAEALSDYGIDACFSILNRPATLSEAMDKSCAAENMRLCASQVFSLIAAIGK